MVCVQCESLGFNILTLFVFFFFFGIKPSHSCLRELEILEDKAATKLPLIKGLNCHD